jgi:putative phosphoesterase
MRIAVLSDVHGNLPALDAVLAEVEAEGFDAVVSGGDVVSGPMPRECLDRLAALGDRISWVRGNADREVVAALDGTLPGELGDDPAVRSARYAAARLTAADRELLASFAPTVRLGEVLVCHGTPASDTAMVTPRTPPERLAAAVGDTDAAMVVGGHVHLQFVQRSGAVQWVNAGSAGMPYEGAPGAFWLAILDGSADLRRTRYDTGAAAAAIRATGYPDAEDVIASITGAITREEAMDAFEPPPPATPSPGGGSAG